MESGVGPSNRLRPDVCWEVAMFKRVLSRSFLGLLAGAILGVVAATPALAYGPENYQVGFAGTGVAPGADFSFGFWGWCAFGGGTVFSSGLATSGTTADCQFAEYVRTPLSNVTCHESVNGTSWAIEPSLFFPIPTFHVTGTTTVNPSGTIPACVAIFGSFPLSFTDFDSLIPALPGHYHLNGFFHLPGEFQIQVTALPS